MFLDSILYHERVFYSCANAMVFVTAAWFALTSGWVEVSYSSLFTLFLMFLAIPAPFVFFVNFQISLLQFINDPVGIMVLILFY